jgi:integrase
VVRGVPIQMLEDRSVALLPDAHEIRSPPTPWIRSLTTSRDPFKPATIRAYAAALRKGVLDEFGSVKLSELTRLECQDLVDRWLAAGMNPRTIAGRIMPLRAVYRRAMSRGDVAVNPTTGLELPAGRGGRERIASPSEAAELLAALPPDARPLWACALFSGLRRGELMALRAVTSTSRSA